MKVAIASGKGGTGKTTIATNLAVFLGEKALEVVYLDCDVEEPNGHLFLLPSINNREEASIPVPVIDEATCNACGECVRFCQFKALVRLGKTVMVFPELCHGCGGCGMLCPRQAITEKKRVVGVVETGDTGRKVAFVHGRLNVGEAMSPPLIRCVLKQAPGEVITVIDAPPGTSCPVITTVRNADFMVLVTEPTPFGINDLALALDMVNELKVPCGIVVNRAEKDNHDVEEFCSRRGVPVIGTVPDRRDVAEAYSRGMLALEAVPELSMNFKEIWENIERLAYT